MNWREFFFPEKPLTRWLIRTAGPRILIRLNPEEASFASVGKSVAFPTVIYLDREDRIIGIGKPPDSSAPFTTQKIFDSGLSEERQQMVVEKFLHFGLHSVLGKGLSVRPFVTIVLRVPIPRRAIEAMLLKAGAGEVMFGAT